MPRRHCRHCRLFTHQSIARARLSPLLDSLPALDANPSRRVPRASAFATCQSPLPGRGPRTAAGLPGRRYGEGPRIQSRGRRLLRFGSRRSMLRRCRRGSQGICIAHRNSSRSESYAACTGFGVNQTAAAHRIEKHLSLSRSSCSHRSSRRPRRRGCDRRTAAAGRRSPWPQ